MEIHIYSMTDVLPMDTPTSQEEKYRRQVSESPNFISRLLALLEKPGSPETKILFLRIVATIGESDRNKIEIGMFIWLSTTNMKYCAMGPTDMSLTTIPCTSKSQNGGLQKDPPPSDQ